MPAGLAVMLSYMIQRRLAGRLKYRSLYEAQVPNRAQSPAHYLEHLQIAVGLIGQRQVPASAGTGPLDLLALLESGIPLELPNNNHLALRALRAHSPCVGKTIESSMPLLKPGVVDIIAILRGGETVLPHPTTMLEEGDQILMIVSREEPEQLAEHLGPAFAVVKSDSRD